MKKIISIILGILLLGTTNIYGWTKYGGDIGLQKVTPGTQQIGNLNISGVGILSDITLQDTTPLITLTDTTAGDNDWSINVDADNFSIIDDTQGLTRLSIDSTGNVGIGTATPGAPLSVVGEVRATSVNDAAAFSVYEGTTMRGSLYHYADVLYVKGVSGLRLVSSGGDIQMLPAVSVDLNSKLIVNIGHTNTDFTYGGGLNIAGNVGISTITPIGKLHTILSTTSPALSGGDRISNLTGVTISNANPSVMTKDATIDDGVAVGNMVIVQSGTNSTPGVELVPDWTITIFPTATPSSIVASLVITDGLALEIVTPVRLDILSPPERAGDVVERIVCSLPIGVIVLMPTLPAILSPPPEVKSVLVCPILTMSLLFKSTLTAGNICISPPLLTRRNPETPLTYRTSA